MAEGINVYDDLDDLDELEGLQDNLNTTTQGDDASNGYYNEQDYDQSSQSNQIEEDFISSLLKTKGIEDKSSIKFEDEYGNINEVDWDSLDNETRLNILDTTQGNPETDLEDSEIELINAIRRSQLSPAEYVQYIAQSGVNGYIRDSMRQNMQFTIDQYDNDDLYVMDLMSRTGISEEEAQEALENAKSNEDVFSKQMGAIRNEYRQIEAENYQQAQIAQAQQAQDQFNQFADSVANVIDNFTTFSDYDLNLEPEDKQELFEFLTGFDAAGNNHFAKTLADPNLVVPMAWFALNGTRMIDDITDYYNKEITQVRKASYAKGFEDGQNNTDDRNFVYKNKSNSSKSSQYYDDFDDEFLT